MPLGVQFLNENKTHEMCSIMKNLHKYVPTRKYQKTYQLPDKDFVCDEECYHRILFGGDQLTACRSRSVQSARCNDDQPVERLDGLLPVTEDWHARMTLMRVRLCICNSYHDIDGIIIFNR